ncbi:GntR family transcriptional regulator [Amycolatopsis jejuensis]|uniref:GntR family transcriptional regulator n=1 Tax=Amycolatopsis jejuensis TaxID=330084 RepID=UPI00068ED743|nr:GntR family transcriptional regulator [Amycolatopsis jejuensis]
MAKQTTRKGGPPAWVRAYDDLRHRILTCALAPGTPISEQGLAKEYGMSPTPVRDAIQRLRQEGLITRRSAVGFEVAPMTFADIRQLAELRWAIESAIVTLAIDRAKPEDVDALRPLAVASQEPMEGAERVAMNRKFHLAVAELAGNPRLVTALGQALDSSSRFFHLGIDGLPPDKMTGTHLDILDAIRDRDVEKARDLVEREAFDNSERVVRALVSGAVSPRGDIYSLVGNVHVTRKGEAG